MLTIWLVVEAAQRIYRQDNRIDAGLMWIVAVVSIFFNLIQIKILHSGDGHYHLGGIDDGGCGHDHDHGHDHEHNHEKGHDHKHDHEKGHDHKHDHEKGHKCKNDHEKGHDHVL